MMVGRLLSCCEGNFSGAMLNFRWVLQDVVLTTNTSHPHRPQIFKLHQNLHQSAPDHPPTVGKKIAPVMQRPLHVRHRPDSGPPFFIRKAIMTLGMAMGIREFLGISKQYVSIGRLVAVFFGEGVFYSTFLYRFCFYLCKVCYSCKKGNRS